MNYCPVRLCRILPRSADERSRSAFDAVAEGEQGQAKQHRAGETQDTLEQFAPCGQLDLIVRERQSARNAYSRLVQHDTGRGGTAKPIRRNATVKSG